MPIGFKIRKKEPDLLLYIFGEGILNMEDLEKFDSFFDKYLKEDNSFKILMDLRKVENASIGVIKQLVDNRKNYDKYADNKVIATSILIDNYIIESLINMLFSIKQPKRPTKITSDIDEACNFLNEYQKI